MRRFRRFFAILFAASVLLGALHEVVHDHHHDIDGHYEQSCPLYLLSHTAAIPAERVILADLCSTYEPFLPGNVGIVLPPAVTVQTRAPPAV